jgi:maltose O-acetyltransferase
MTDSENPNLDPSWEIQKSPKGGVWGLFGRLPLPAKRFLRSVYLRLYDVREFVAEAVGWVPSHTVRLFCYRHLLGIRVGQQSSIHRNCRFYHPPGVQIGPNVIINRDVLLDGRMGVTVGANASISEGAMILSLEHDPDSPHFASRGAPVTIGERAFIGARAIILPGRVIGEGAVVAAGAVVAKDVEPYTIVGGVPAKPIGERSRDLAYQLDYSKFLG